MEAFKTIPFISPFILNIEISEEKETTTDLIEFLRKMNIQHVFKQMPSKPIKLNIPFVLKEIVQTRMKCEMESKKVL